MYPGKGRAEAGLAVAASAAERVEQQSDNDDSNHYGKNDHCCQHGQERFVIDGANNHADCQRKQHRKKTDYGFNTGKTAAGTVDITVAVHIHTSI